MQTQFRKAHLDEDDTTRVEYLPADAFENLREEGKQDQKPLANPMKGSQGL